MLHHLILKNNIIKKILFWISMSGPSLMIAGCGYHSNNEEMTHQFPVISVAYFSGDRDGSLTDNIIQGLCFYGFTYSNRKNTMILQGEMINDNTEYVGYQYDRHPLSGQLINRLIPNEGRREITIRFSLIDSDSQQALYGPFVISATSDYDFCDSDSLQSTSFIDSSGTRQSVLAFSLGQLDSAQGAHAASHVPIYQNLTRKIVEIISHLPYNKVVEH